MNQALFHFTANTKMDKKMETNLIRELSEQETIEYLLKLIDLSISGSIMYINDGILH